MLSIYLTLEEGNLILEALAEKPFKLVFELIGELNKQANQLFTGSNQLEERQLFVFSKKDAALIIKALGAFPYDRVHLLLSSLNQQINEQHVHGVINTNVEI